VRGAWRRWSGRALFVGFLFLAAPVTPSSGAQPAPIGAEQQVNVYTISDQNNPSVGTDALGNFVVTWDSFFQDGDSVGVFGRRFERDGSVIGVEFQVNTYTPGAQAQSSVAVCDDGDFVVAWQSSPYPTSNPAQDGDGGGVFAQRYASDGAPAGTEFQVNVYTSGNQVFPSVAKDAAGDFIVAWHSVNKLGDPATGTQDGFSGGIFARRFASDGTANGDEFQVNSYTAAFQGYADVGAAPDGAFVVVWLSNGQDGSSFSLFGQRFASDGSPEGDEFQVSSYTPGIQERASVAVAPGGNFLVAWQDDSRDGNNRGVFAQLFGSDGSRLGAEFQVNAFTPSYQGFPDVATDDQGRFIIAWQSFDQGGDSFDIFANRYASDGTPLASEFRVNSYLVDLQERPAVGAGPGEFFVIAWQSRFPDGSFSAVRAQRFDVQGGAPVPVLAPAGLFLLALGLVVGGLRMLRRRSDRS
jgi:hypothetical protein